MLKLVLFLSLTLVILSCKGLSQPDSNTQSDSELSIGTEIDKLGDGVARVFQDSKNNYWFCHEGIVKYDGMRLIQFTTDDGLYANRVRDVQEDHLGNIYFDTGEGINKFDGKTIEKLTVTDDAAKAKMLHANDLWFAGDWDMNGVYRYDGKDLFHVKLPKHALDEEAREYTLEASYEIYANYTTYKDNLGNVWMGNSIFGACRFEGKDFFWVSEREMTELDWGPSMGVRTIIQDSEGHFYFGSNVSTKYAISEENGITQYQKLPGIDTSQEPELPSACMSMVMDNEGNFWMAHYKGGVWKYDGESFQHFPVLINRQEAELFTIYKDRSGTLWLGTHNAGVWKFNGQVFERFTPQITQE